MRQAHQRVALADVFAEKMSDADARRFEKVRADLFGKLTVGVEAEKMRVNFADSLVQYIRCIGRLELTGALRDDSSGCRMGA